MYYHHCWVIRSYSSMPKQWSGMDLHPLAPCALSREQEVPPQRTWPCTSVLILQNNALFLTSSPRKLVLLSQSSTQLIVLTSKSLNFLNDALKKIIFLLEKDKITWEKSLSSWYSQSRCYMLQKNWRLPPKIYEAFHLILAASLL